MLSSDSACPGLFYATPAQDGILSRLRIPGGILNQIQCDAIADIADSLGGGYLQVTNRANLQIRELETPITTEALEQLQFIGLASLVAEVDAIRNIMSSPTAGIDRQEWIDVRPLVMSWNQQIVKHPEWSILSAKFSVCFDGGGAVSVSDRPNDITFSAINPDAFRLRLSLQAGAAPQDVGVVLPFHQCLSMLIALTEVYCDRTVQLMGNASSRRKPRLRDVLHQFGVESYLEAVEQRLSEPLQVSSAAIAPTDRLMLEYGHLGVHPQRQPGLFYIGVGVPLGRLATGQLRKLAALSAQYGCGELRLTPWQNVLIADIPAELLSQVQQEIQALGLHWSATQISSAIVACSGKTGCASSATDTQRDAAVLITNLESRINLDRPVNIHMSGCKKSCAQHIQGDITLLGVDCENDTCDRYDLYVAHQQSNEIDNAETNFGQKLYQSVAASEITGLIERLLTVYQNQQIASESFAEFTTRHTISQLEQLFGDSQERQPRN